MKKLLSVGFAILTTLAMSTTAFAHHVYAPNYTSAPAATYACNGTACIVDGVCNGTCTGTGSCAQFSGCNSTCTGSRNCVNNGSCGGHTRAYQGRYTNGGYSHRSGGHHGGGCR